MVSGNSKEPQISKIPRPRVLGGLTIKAATGCGNMYVHLTWYKGSLFEVFATLGKSGGCAMGQAEAVTRGITMGLRSGIPVDEYVDQLKGITCQSPLPFPRDEAASSCPDAIARVLQKYGKLTVEQVARVILKGDEIINGESSEEEAQAMATLEVLREEREKQDLYG